VELTQKLEKDLAKAYNELIRYVESMGAKIATADVSTLDLTVNTINEMINGMNGVISKNNTIITQALADLKKTNSKYLEDAKKRVPKSMTKFVGFDNNSLNAMIQMQYLGIETVQAQAVDAIKSATITYINTPTTIDKLLQDLQGRIDQLEAHTKTQLNTFYREYSQTLENQIAEQIGFGENKDDIWEYSGAPLQDNSHDECVWALTQKQGAPYFTNEEKIAFESGGLYSHSEPRWNCQHDFVMTNLTYAEAFGTP
jgi:uncharacterized protein YukE